MQKRKLVVVGSGTAGKTSFIHRLVHDKFEQSYKATQILLKWRKNVNPGIKETECLLSIISFVWAYTSSSTVQED